jgi:GxxExxY protein
MHERLSKESIFLNQISSVVPQAAITVHREMGPGLLESVYRHCLIKELKERRIKVDTMVPVQLYYKGMPLNKDYVIDMLVEDEIILELKSIEILLPIHEAQIISYLKLANKRLGFLINFNVPLLKSGFKRFVNNFRKQNASAGNLVLIPPQGREDARERKEILVTVLAFLRAFASQR